jgi:hypothetical protein
MVVKARILVAALIALAVLLVLSPAGATRKCYGETGAGMTYRERVWGTAHDRTLYFQVCIPEHKP